MHKYLYSYFHPNYVRISCLHIPKNLPGGGVVMLRLRSGQGIERMLGIFPSENEPTDRVLKPFM